MPRSSRSAFGATTRPRRPRARSPAGAAQAGSGPRSAPTSPPNSLLLATWNIRDFNSNKFGHGPRLQNRSTTLRRSSPGSTWWRCRRSIATLPPCNRSCACWGAIGTIWSPTPRKAAAATRSGWRSCTITSRVTFRNVAGRIVITKSGVGRRPPVRPDTLRGGLSGGLVQVQPVLCRISLWARNFRR